MEEVACLSFVESPELLAEIFSTAKQIKEEIYGSRLVLFAPLYISNRCANECTYCAFRATNTALKRRTLTQEEIAEETRILIRQGHKRVLMVAGEALPPQGFQYILDSIATIYDTSRPGRNPARQRESGAANDGAFPPAEGGGDRNLPALPGDLSPAYLCRRST